MVWNGWSERPAYQILAVLEVLLGLEVTMQITGIQVRYSLVIKVRLFVLAHPPRNISEPASSQMEKLLVLPLGKVRSLPHPLRQPKSRSDLEHRIPHTTIVTQLTEGAHPKTSGRADKSLPIYPPIFLPGSNLSFQTLLQIQIDLRIVDGIGVVVGIQNIFDKAMVGS